MSATTSPPPHVPTLQKQDLKGKVALITGATKGIGRAICIELATRGASILGTYSSDDSTRDFEAFSQSIGELYSKTLERGPTAIGVKADISLAETSNVIMPILHALRTRFDGKVDIVVFNAAVMTLAMMGEGSVREEMVDSALAGNVKFPVLLVESFLRENVFRRDGRVIGISSEEVRVRRPNGGAVYAATKAALECLMRKWADELGNRPGMEGTTFNSVSVGFTKTAAYDKIPSDVRDKLTAADAAEVAVGDRIGEAEDIAGIVGLLVSEKAWWMSGSVVDASGGKAKIL